MKRALTAMLVSLGPFASGCATEQASRVEAPYVPDRDQTVRVVRCEDRTGTQTGRDLAREATQHLVEKLQDAKLFQVADDAPLVLTCDIERFEEGSALKRWLMPGWGATQADIAVMAWRQPGDQILATFRSHAHVDAGGLYTIGADRYILSVALDDIVGQLRQWRAGTPPQAGAQK
jgi:Domain of unknown function (DUF4410)